MPWTYSLTSIPRRCHYEGDWIVEFNERMWIGFSLDILVCILFAIASGWAFLAILLIPYWTGVLIGLLLYVILRALAWLGAREDLDI